MKLHKKGSCLDEGERLSLHRCLGLLSSKTGFLALAAVVVLLIAATNASAVVAKFDIATVSLPVVDEILIIERATVLENARSEMHMAARDLQNAVDFSKKLHGHCSDVFALSSKSYCAEL